MRICSIEGCGKKHSGKGLCKAHYNKEHHKVYYYRPEIREHKRQYKKKHNALPETKEHKKAYTKDWRARPEVIKHTKEYKSQPWVKEYERKRKREYDNSPMGIAVMLCSVAKKRAQKRNINFNLTTDYVYSILPVPLVCPLLNITLTHGNKKAQAASPTLDRIKPELGYIQGNVMVISYLANMIKSTATANQIMLVAQNLKKLGF